MARTTGDEELQLKKRARRRLIGATVLVMIVVLVLPMVLDPEPKPVSQDIDIRIPSPDAGAFKSKIVPIAPAPDSKPAAKSQAGPATKSDGTAKDVPGGPPVADAAPASKPETTVKDKGPAKTAGGTEASKPTVKAEAEPDDARNAAVPAGGSHIVQVVALRNAERAQEVHEKIRAAGIKSYTETVNTPKGDVTRVRAGPFATREEAEKARDQLQTLGLNGKVTPR